MKGYVAIAVEDDAVYLLYGQVHFDAEGKVIDIRADHPDRKPYHSETVARPVPDIRELFPDFLRKYVLDFIGGCLKKGRPVAAVGISVFGNVDPKNGVIVNRPSVDKYANMRRTMQVREDVEHAFPELKGVELVLSNDASAAAMGELVSGNGKNHGNAFAYAWLGRGVNVGIILNNEVHGGFLHPEMSHFFPRIDERDHEYVTRSKTSTNTSCIVHRDCLLGLMSLRALVDRENHGMDRDTIMSIYANYTAHLCLALTVTIAPARIIADGYVFRSGYLDHKKTLALVRENFQAMIGDFPLYPQIKTASSYIVPGALASQAGLHGIVELVKRRLANQSQHDMMARGSR